MPTVGERYELLSVLARGGTSTVHLGRLRGAGGFQKPIAIKRLHPHLAADPELRTLLVDEARLVSRISHPGVVGVLDVVESGDEVFVVLEYVHGVTLAELAERRRVMPPDVAVAIVGDALEGLHAAHHARGADGQPLQLVHRDVSPRNVMVTEGGAGKLLDFGIARARARARTTREGTVRGSLPYMAPEQLEDGELTPRTDLYAASVVLWEQLTGQRLFDGDSEAAIVKKILDHDVPAPSVVNADVPRALDGPVLRGLAREPAARFRSGLELLAALEGALAPARTATVAAWVKDVAGDELARRQARVDAEAPPAADAPADRAPPRDASRSDAPPAVPPSPRRARARVRVVMGAALALLLAVVLARAVGPRGTGTAMRDPGARAPVEASTPVEPPAPPLPSAATAPSAAVSAVPAISAISAISAMPPGAPARGSRPPPASPRASAPAPAASECPPFYVDEGGVRRFNRECLR